VWSVNFATVKAALKFSFISYGDQRAVMNDVWRFGARKEEIKMKAAYIEEYGGSDQFKIMRQASILSIGKYGKAI
jgi:hypothetical protein